MITPFANALASLLALGCAMFLWRQGSSILRNGALLALGLVIFSLYVFFGFFPDGKEIPLELEHYPFKMLALCLCFSTTALKENRRRFLVLAQCLWLWVELFGGITLYYRGLDMAWTRIIAILGMALLSTLLRNISKEMEFCLMVFWFAVWVFF